MAQVFYRKKFSYYLGEQRALGDIVEVFTASIQPTPTPTPTSQTPTPTPTPTATPGIGNQILSQNSDSILTENEDNIIIE
jgi:hypothetical protein